LSNRITYGTKHFHHPLVGDITLDYEALAVTGDSDQILGIYSAEPGTPHRPHLSPPR
jgi:hypothetical protein